MEVHGGHRDHGDPYLNERLYLMIQIHHNANTNTNTSTVQIHIQLMEVHGRQSGLYVSQRTSLTIQIHYKHIANILQIQY